MHTPARILRGELEDIPGARRLLSAREMDRRDTILAAGRRVMANHGCRAITLPALATALFMAPGTLRRYFPDMEALLGEILRAHLHAIADALGRVQATGAEYRPALRAAYRAATRTPMGGPTEAHLLLLLERHHLPPDERDSVETTRALLGETLAGEHGAIALGLLDMPDLDTPTVEAMLALLPTTASAESAPPPPKRITVMPSRPAPPPEPEPPDDGWPRPSLFANVMRELARAGP
jgi:AcrR family transcriptional regulator